MVAERSVGVLVREEHGYAFRQQIDQRFFFGAVVVVLGHEQRRESRQERYQTTTEQYAIRLIYDAFCDDSNRHRAYLVENFGSFCTKYGKFSPPVTTSEPDSEPDIIEFGVSKCST